MKFAPVIMLLLGLVAAAPGLHGVPCALAAPEPQPAPDDSLMTAWGPHPARADSNTALPSPHRTPAWQTMVLVPYYIIGVPLTIVDKAGKGAILGLDRLGAFRATEQAVGGIPDPIGNFWLPDLAYGDAQGWQFGIIGQRPEFPLRGMRTKLRLALSTTDASLWTLGSIAPLGEQSWIDFGGGSLVLARTDYYGTGQGTSQADRSYYRRDSDWFGASWRQDFGDHFEFLALSHYSTQRARESRYETDRALEIVFADDIPYGYDMASSGLTGGIQIGYDSTDQTGRPDRGTRFLVFTQYFEPTDDTQTRFWTNGATVEHYLQLGRPQRTLAIKGWWLRERPLEGDPVPFTRLLRNRVPYQLRSYSSARFHATGLTGLTAEYRWPAWIQNKPAGSGIDAYVFGDIGQPFDHADEVALDNLLWSAGFGFRVINQRADFSIKLEIAYGDEGTQVRVSTQQLFQFIKAGFYDGSEPVPVLR